MSDIQTDTNTIQPMQRLLSVDSIAEMFDVPKSKIYNLTRTNQIPHFKLGKYCRFDPVEVGQWLDGHRVKAR